MFCQERINREQQSIKYVQKEKTKPKKSTLFCGEGLYNQNPSMAQMRFQPNISQFQIILMDGFWGSKIVQHGVETTNLKIKRNNGKRNCKFWLENEK